MDNGNGCVGHAAWHGSGVTIGEFVDLLHFSSYRVFGSHRMCSVVVRVKGKLLQTEGYISDVRTKSLIPRLLMCQSTPILKLLARANCFPRSSRYKVHMHLGVSVCCIHCCLQNPGRTNDVAPIPERMGIATLW